MNRKYCTKIENWLNWLVLVKNNETNDNIAEISKLKKLQYCLIDESSTKGK
jgi:hypothetical protein